jgi:hypothetical protein
MKPVTGVEIEQAKKTAASNGNSLPDPIREGDIRVFIDITKNQ